MASDQVETALPLTDLPVKVTSLRKRLTFLEACQKQSRCSSILVSFRGKKIIKGCCNEISGICENPNDKLYS
jgi:hypothetical protein